MEGNKFDHEVKVSPYLETYQITGMAGVNTPQKTDEQELDQVKVDLPAPKVLAQAQIY